MAVQQARTLFTVLPCYWCRWGQEIQIEQVIRREVCGAEQTHEVWEDFLLWKGREIAFTELPRVGLSIHEKPRTCRFTNTRLSACSIAVPLLGFEHGALYNLKLASSITQCRQPFAEMSPSFLGKWDIRDSPWRLTGHIHCWKKWREMLCSKQSWAQLPPAANIRLFSLVLHPGKQSMDTSHLEKSAALSAGRKILPLSQKQNIRSFSFGLP